MTSELYNLLRSILHAYEQPYGFESRDFVEGMDKLDDMIKDGYCEEGDKCCCGGDVKAVKTSCSRWKQ